MPTPTQTQTQSQLDAAADLIDAAELAGLKALLEEFDRIDAKLAEVVAAVPAPRAYQSTVHRVAGELRSQLLYRRTSELPSAIATIEGPQAIPAVAAPTP